MPLSLMECVCVQGYVERNNQMFVWHIHIVGMQVAPSRLLWYLLATAIPYITHKHHHPCSLTPVKPPALVMPPVLTHLNDTTSICTHPPTPKNN